MLQIRAKECVKADYIQESLHLFLDIFNIFIALLMIGYGIFLVINTYLNENIDKGKNFYINLFLAIIISMAIIFGFQLLIPQPEKAPVSEEQTFEESSVDLNIQNTNTKIVINRDEVISLSLIHI